MENKICGYGLAWRGPCQNPGDGRCANHAETKCSSCGASATRECDETMGPFVCGAPVCDACEHTLCANGCTSGAALPRGLAAHCKKTDQRYMMWMCDGAKEHNESVYAADWPEGRVCNLTGCEVPLGMKHASEFCSSEHWQKDFANRWKTPPSANKD